MSAWRCESHWDGEPSSQCQLEVGHEGAHEGVGFVAWFEGDQIQTVQKTMERLRAENERLREELRDVLVADKDGTLHHPECIGIHGYSCKPWCESARAALSTPEPNFTLGPETQIAARECNPTKTSTPEPRGDGE